MEMREGAVLSSRANETWQQQQQQQQHNYTNHYTAARRTLRDLHLKPGCTPSCHLSDYVRDPELQQRPHIGRSV